jgi:hypothetical protein
MAALTSLGCGSKSSTAATDGTSTDPTVITDKVVSDLTNKLAAAFPSGLAISAFAKTTSTSLTDEDYNLEEGEVAEQSLKAKIAEQKKILSGEGSCIPKALTGEKKAAEESCYEFDQDMIYTRTTKSGVDAIKGTKDGKSAGGEACLVSFARSKITEVVEIVDKNTGMVQSMMCLAKKAGKAELPAVGASLDLKEAMSAGMGDAAKNITAAGMKRLEDVDGRPVYRTDIDLTDKGGRSRKIHMVHSPAADGTNDTFNGTMWGTQSENAQPNPGQGAEAPPTKLRAISIVYSRTKEADGTPRITYELRSSSMLKDTLDKEQGTTGAGFTKTGLLDLNAGTDANGAFPGPGNRDQSGNVFIAFNVNPDNNAGTMSYWQNPGANYNENARGMVFKMEADAEGKLGGCASSGAASSTQGPSAYSIRKSLKEGKPELLIPTGFYHPFHYVNMGNNNCAATPVQATEGGLTTWGCTRQDSQGTMTWFQPNITGTSAENFVKEQTGSVVTLQCFKQDSTGAYIIDTAKTTSAAGYDLLNTGNADDKAKVIQPPKLDGVKPVETK